MINDILFTPIRLSELEILIEKSFERVLLKVNSNQQTKPEPQSNFINIDEFCLLHPKKLSKATVYSQLSLKKIPTELIFKPEGSKKVLFYKDLVLQWIENGMPTNAQIIADDYVNNRK